MTLSAPTPYFKSLIQGQESINFEDVLCQMMDMVHPEDTHAITLHDLVRPDKRMISGMDVFFVMHVYSATYVPLLSAHLLSSSINPLIPPL
ncbi:hypothetical protein EON65_21870, partial [archaeon]